MEQQLKRVNPQAFKEYQMQKQSGNPNEYLNKITNNFNNQQKQQWNNLMNMFNTTK